MPDYRALARRLITAAGLAAAVVGAAALGGPAAGADAPISPVRVLAFGHEATLSFTTAEPTNVTVTHAPATTRAAAGPVAPITAAPSPLLSTTSATAFGAPSAARQIAQPVGGGHVFRQYTTTHEVKLTGLTSNTAYDVSVVAETQAGQRHTAAARVLTARQRVRVTLREIDIKDDGDLDIPYVVDRAGDPRWLVGLSWKGGSVGGCFPIGCAYGSYYEGRIFPRNAAGQSLTWLFAEENFDTLPAALTLSTYAEEDDGVFGRIGAAIVDCYSPTAYGCEYGNDAVAAPWQLPRGVEFSSTTVTVRGVDKLTGFDSVLTFTFETFHDLLSYPAPKRNAPSSTWK